MIYLFLPYLLDIKPSTGCKNLKLDLNCVEDDDIASEWLASIPAQRLGDPKELASLAAYLASPAGGYIRGQSIAVDGGRLNSI